MSEFYTNKRTQGLPPLGERPDFSKLDQDDAEHDSQLEHVPLNNFPELVTSFDTITQNINAIRTRVGAPEMPSDSSVVRLMNQDQWNNLSSTASASPAHYDPLSGNIYQLFDEERYSRSKIGQISTVYTMAHELSHKTTHGLEKYSFHLSEGIADFLAQLTLENGALESFIDKRDLDHYRQIYLEAGPVIIGGYEFKAKDIFVVPSENGAGLSRIPQLRLIEAIQATMQPEHFNDFLRGAFTNDTTLVKSMLTKQFGAELTKLLDDILGNVDPRGMTARILQTATS